MSDYLADRRGTPRCLSLVQEPSGQRHYLDGRGIHAGTTLEVRLESGKWLQVRYESEWPPEGLRPAFYLAVAGITSAKLDLPFDAQLRWPSDRFGRKARADVIDPTGDCELLVEG